MKRRTGLGHWLGLRLTHRNSKLKPKLEASGSRRRILEPIRNQNPHGPSVNNTPKDFFCATAVTSPFVSSAQPKGCSSTSTSWLRKDHRPSHFHFFSRHRSPVRITTIAEKYVVKMTIKKVPIARQQQPNRFTKAFKKMKEVCPNHIKAYATCVMDAEAVDSVSKGACAKEFALVKECFRQVRGFR